MEWLAYTSDALDYFSDADLRALEAVAQRKNREHGVTGALMYLHQVGQPGFFVQYLEGKPEALDIILRRIQLDRRHSNIHVFDRDNITVRRFPAWSMKAVDLAGRPPLCTALGELLTAQSAAEKSQKLAEPVLGYLDEAHSEVLHMKHSV